MVGTTKSGSTGKATATKTSATKVAAKKAATKKVVAKKVAAKKTAPESTAHATPARTPAVAGKGRAKPAAGAMDASARIDARIESLGDWRGERLAEIRTLIHEVDPQVVEEWKWMGTPVWSHDGMYVLANAHKDKVKLTFFHGARLADHGGLFNAGLDGNKWRAIDYRQGDKLDKGALKALLRDAVAFNSANVVPRSRGSKA